MHHFKLKFQMAIVSI